MCRMLGIRNYSRAEHGEALEDFFLLAEKGNVLPGSSPGHRDGWGIGFYKKGRPVLHKSGACLTGEKADFERLARAADGSPVLVVHLRKAVWENTSCARHSHPFLAGDFMFAHNGTITDYQRLLSEPGTTGETAEVKPDNPLDTEVFFHYVLRRIHLGAARALKESLREIIGSMSYSSLNCLMSDGKRLYAFREYTKNPDYYTLFHARLGRSELVCSERVCPGLAWKALPKGRLLIA